MEKYRAGKTKHTNSKRVTDLSNEIQLMEKELRQRDVAMTYPTLQQQVVPMLGHTKGTLFWPGSQSSGNTKNNRKKIKQQQITHLQLIHAHLMTLLKKSGPTGLADEMTFSEEWDSEDDYEF